MRSFGDYKAGRTCACSLLLWRLLLVFGLWLPDSGSSFGQPRLPGRLGQDRDAGRGMGRASADLHRAVASAPYGASSGWSASPSTLFGEIRWIESSGIEWVARYVSCPTLRSAACFLQMSALDITASAKIGGVRASDRMGIASHAATLRCEPANQPRQSNPILRVESAIRPTTMGPCRLNQHPYNLKTNGNCQP